MAAEHTGLRDGAALRDGADPKESLAVFRYPQINVYVQDVERVSRFYTDLLGFRETYRIPETLQPDLVGLRLEGLSLSFASIDVARRKHGFTAGT